MHKVTYPWVMHQRRLQASSQGLACQRVAMPREQHGSDRQGSCLSAAEGRSNTPLRQPTAR
jgi:hypothetical protein